MAQLLRGNIGPEFGSSTPSSQLAVIPSPDLMLTSSSELSTSLTQAHTTTQHIQHTHTNKSFKSEQT